MTNHLMLDLETVSTRSDAAVLSIGACFFTEEERGRVGETFFARVAVQPQLDAGMHLNWATVQWWMQQEREALEVSIGEDAGFDPAHALIKFTEFAQEREFSGIWSNGASFDLPILANLYHVCEMEPPWSYRQERCLRTLTALAPEVFRVQPLLPHDPVEDAKAQAFWVQDMLSTIKG